MLVLLILCVVPFAVAEPITAKCCFPSKFTAVITENGGTKMPYVPLLAIDFVTHMYADLTKSLVRLDRNGTTNGQPDIQTMYFDYSKHLLHFVKDGHCTPTSLAATIPPLCLRHNFHYDGRFVFGSKANNIISDKWTNSNTATNITTSFYVTEDCKPLIQISTELSSAVSSQNVVTYSSVSESVPDDVFNLPASCHS